MFIKTISEGQMQGKIIWNICLQNIKVIKNQKFHCMLDTKSKISGQFQHQTKLKIFGQPYELIKILGHHWYQIYDKCIFLKTK
jgi:hypothetical protein